MGGKGGGGGGDIEIPETAQEQELAEIAGERWQRYKDTFRPLENQYMAEVEDLGSRAAMADATGRAASSVQQNIDTGPLDPNRGIGAQGASLGQARAQAVSNAGLGVEEQHKRGLQGLIQLGQGQSANALQGMGETAGQAAQEAQQEAFADFNRRQAWGNLAGNVAGAGLRYGMQNMGGGGGTASQPGSVSGLGYSQPAWERYPSPQGDFSMGYGLSSGNGNGGL